MKSQFDIMAIKMPTLEQVAAGELPYLLMRWPRKVELPETVRDGLKEKGVVTIPTVSMNIPFTGAAVAKFMEIQSGIKDHAKRFALEIDFDIEEVRLVGATKFYLNIMPIAINLNKVVELEPQYQGGQTNEVSDELAKAYNEAVRAAATARTQARATPSGTVVVAEVPDAAPAASGAAADTKEVF